jgi:hypothetical protein
MDLTQLSPAVLSELIALSEQKQSLLAEVAKIDETILKVASGNVRPTASAPRAAKAAKAPKAPAAKPAPVVEEAAPAAEKAPAAPRAKRGALKEGILQALQAAGPEGISISDLASQLDVDAKNVNVWFSTTGKKIEGLTKLAPGRYALGAAAAAVLAEAPAFVGEVASVEPEVAEAAPEVGPVAEIAPVIEEAAPVAIEEVVTEIVVIPETVAEEVVAEIAPAAEETLTYEAEESIPVAVVSDEIPAAEEEQVAAAEPEKSEAKPFQFELSAE